ncbi:hypothetical protein KVR01_007824 [Diaporthe batatas]|uniref:uncharacterized protein n=1 Tax=Diaporthe batatas TaxID=748121 RepID=UPI001D05523B|nr:uncharacterized protein KVR01_007824 [Diaporthe batatas]KAG8162059.1 hypothetical protein KVR01_007824 [Diaporthe batatas]
MTAVSPTRDSAALLEEQGLLDSDRRSFEALNETPATPPDEDTRTLQPPPRTLGFQNGVAIVIGMQIGSGIFSSPASVIGHVHSSSLAVTAWFVAGLLAWAGAASVVQLGTLVPVNGGFQEYLSFLYDDSYGCLFAWCWIIISRPCGLAMVSLIFSEYLYEAIASGQVQDSHMKAMAVMSIISITVLNCLGTPVGKRMGSIFLTLKVIGLLSIPLAALIYRVSSVVPGGDSSYNRSEDSNGPATQSTSDAAPDPWATLGGLTDSVLAAVFAYGGWESISFVVGEIQNVEVTLPKILHTSMAAVIVLFVSANLALYAIVPIEDMETSNTIALAFGYRIAGTAGKIFYAWIVCLSCLGTLHAIVFSAGRLTQAAGSHSYVPQFLGRSATPPLQRLRGLCGERGRHRSSVDLDVTRQNIPANAMLLNAALACIFVLTGTFRQLLTFKGG